MKKRQMGGKGAEAKSSRERFTAEDAKHTERNDAS